jgi:molybdopterin-containing oxidoreductase family membrane subunit
MNDAPTKTDELHFNNQIEEDVLVAMSKPGHRWWLGFMITATIMVSGFALWGFQIYKGIGVVGKTHPTGWGFYITSFVFWVGIAHSGTLISAVLLLVRAPFRNRFNRTAEAMTIFAVMTAGLFPLIHLGRMWYFYWLMPYPNQRQLWVNFKSPLLWDVFAVSTYLTISVIFWYVGMVPDLAIIRRRATGIKRWIYGALSLGWRGTRSQWKHYNAVCYFLAAFATPLVFSVHSVVSWDFAMSIVPGWHTTIFGPYFVAGAIFSGCAMVMTLVIPTRTIFRLEKYITHDHMESLAKLTLFTGLIVTYSYLVEFLIAGIGNNIYEKAMMSITDGYRLHGPYQVWVLIMFGCNCIVPLFFFIRKLRRSIGFLFVASILINVGMWFERFNIITTSLSHEYNPYSWGLYNAPTLWDLGIMAGSFGFFFTLFLIFARTLPILAIMEIKETQ